MKIRKKILLYSFILNIFMFTSPLITVDEKSSISSYFDNKSALITTAVVLGAISYGAHNYNNKSKLFSIPAAHTTKIQTIIFDLDGVLCTTNKLRAFQEIGIASTLRYVTDQQVIPSEKHLFDTLAPIPAQSTYTSYNKGLQMPQIMIDWQTGMQDPIAIQQAVLNAFETSQIPGTQKKWVLQSLLMMTNPEKFIATRQIITQNVQLLHSLKDKGYKLYVLSNWDPASFPLMKEQFPQIFMYHEKPLFDGIMISGDIQVVKPETLIFEKFLEKFNLKAQRCIFIDDEPANIQNAQKLGIHVILSKPQAPSELAENVVAILKNHEMSLT